MEKEPNKYASELEKRRKPLKDVDSVERARLAKALVYLVPVGLIFFFLVTTAASSIVGLGPGQSLLAGLVLGLAGPSIVYGLVNLTVVKGTTSMIDRLYGGGGGEGEPRLASTWRSQGLSARGSHSEALEALEDEAALYPDDPGPCMRAAALCIEELDDPEGAVRWYHRARDAKDTTPETDAFISVRLADLYETVGQPAPAMVELRRLLELHQDSPYAKTARNRLAELKAAQAAKHLADPEG
jgi:tetratricopeptide (TPR) repeat protein